jgi:hypothetical protein
MSSMTLPHPGAAPGVEALPGELLTLRERVRAMPEAVRTELEPIVIEALEQARYRGRVLTIARDALVRLRLELELARFDLDATRREREDLRRLLGDGD